jgi:hypothetical protein
MRVDAWPPPSDNQLAPARARQYKSLAAAARVVLPYVVSRRVHAASAIVARVHSDSLQRAEAFERARARYAATHVPDLYPAPLLSPETIAQARAEYAARERSFVQHPQHLPALQLAGRGTKERTPTRMAVFWLGKNILKTMMFRNVRTV